MAITLGTVTFDESQTSVREKLEEVGGRNEREIVLSGSICGESSVAAIDVQLDTILDAASVEDFSAALSLRSGRRLLVRRASFQREVSAEVLVGAFTLTLEARDPFEESELETAVNWAIAVSGATLNVAALGTVYARPAVALLATGALVNPSFSDGVRTLSYAGIVGAGDTLLMDSVGRRVTLEGVDVTPYTSGLFPRISPEGTTLTYTDDASSSHTAGATVTFRDRWW